MKPLCGPAAAWNSAGVVRELLSMQNRGRPVAPSLTLARPLSGASAGPIKQL